MSLALAACPRKTQRSIEFVSQNKILLEEKRLELEVSIRRVKDDEEVVARLRDEYEQKHTELVERQEQLSEQMAVKKPTASDDERSSVAVCNRRKMKRNESYGANSRRYQKELSEVYTPALRPRRRSFDSGRRTERL